MCHLENFGKSPSEVNKALELGRIPDLIVEFGLASNFTCCEKLPKLLYFFHFFTTKNYFGPPRDQLETEEESV